MTYNPEDFIRRYTSELAAILRQLDPGPITAAVSALYGAWRDGKPVLFCGNGGSGASCSHIVNDLQKNISMETSKPLKAICLSDAVPLVSAWANDYGWPTVFASQVATWCESGSILVAVSGSGNSQNVLNAVAEAHCEKATVIGLTGFDGGKMARLVDIQIHLPTDSMQQAEDAHMVVLHLLFLLLKERIASKAE